MQTTRPFSSKPSKAVWGMSCGSGVPSTSQKMDADNEEFRQKLMIHGIGRRKRFVYIN